MKISLAEVRARGHNSSVYSIECSLVLVTPRIFLFDIEQKNPRGHEYQTRLNETRFGPKKSRPQYISAQKISTHFDEIAR